MSKNITFVLLFLLVLPISFSTFADSLSKPSNCKNFTFSHYSVKEFNEKKPIKTKGGKWGIAFSSFSNSDWSLFCNSEYGMQVKELLSVKTNDVRLKNLEYIGEDNRLPNELTGIDVDFLNYILLSRLKIVVGNKGMAKDLKEKYYYAGFHQQRIVKLVSVVRRSGGDGIGDKIHTYYYNDKGQLVIASGDRDVDAGELFNDLILWWERNELKKVFWITGQEIDDIELKLIEYSSLQ